MFNEDDGNGAEDGDETGPDNTDDGNGTEDEDNTGPDNTDDREETEEDTEADPIHRWPAIEAGEVISNFEDLGKWDVIHGEVLGAPEEARTGSQAALLESDDGIAKMRMIPPESMDLRDWDISLAVKPEQIDRFIVKYIAPDGEHKLTSVRFPPDDHEDGWFRVDAGYEHKPDGEPDLSDVTQLQIILDPEDGESSRAYVDDLRRTPAAENGQAIIAFYGGLNSHWEIGADRLEQRGWPAAVAVPPGRVGNSGRMDVDQLRQLRDRDWDVSVYPSGQNFATQSEQQQRSFLESARENIEALGFEDGARHYFSPTWRTMSTTTHRAVRDVFDSGYLHGACTSGIPPTGTSTVSAVWGPALNNGVRRHINLADQYQTLVVLRIPAIVENSEKTQNTMSIDEFERLLNHIEVRGLDVVTPTQLFDGEAKGGGGDSDTLERPEGIIFETGQSHSFVGTDDNKLGSFDLDDGIVTAAFEHDGAGDFEARLVPQDGDVPNDVLIQTTGDADGDAVARLDGDTYQLEVTADSDWEIDLTQPEVHADDLRDLPASAEADGSTAIGPLWTEGNLRLDIDYRGDDELIIDSYGADGSWEQVVNQTGSFSSGRSVGAGGVVWLNVQTGGPWSMDIGQQ